MILVGMGQHHKINVLLPGKKIPGKLFFYLGIGASVYEHGMTPGTLHEYGVALSDVKEHDEEQRALPDVLPDNKVSYGEYE